MKKTTKKRKMKKKRIRKLIHRKAMIRARSTKKR